ncbi:hypothetical protein RFI_34446 [Reticulomyxa filosa]|uniref:Uncharacterized protein n=1 Tax=Reticulomyxa filosa TaxID=46433 RepID=X6LMZ5_RETFI|nr:hypothetical protein RFI_34446 [Reticulomyxa filosa]|eukprot:ETO02964.1 hypothetical protein RFI_34446 [Reticulomyxa filosa]
MSNVSKNCNEAIISSFVRIFLAIARDIFDKQTFKHKETVLRYLKSFKFLKKKPFLRLTTTFSFLLLFDERNIVFRFCLFDFDKQLFSSLQNHPLCKSSVRHSTAQGYPKQRQNKVDILLVYIFLKKLIDLQFTKIVIMFTQ